MNDYLQIIGLTLIAGMAMPLGAVLARFENIQTDWLRSDFRHFVMAFGGGALLSAVALVLVPEGSQVLSTGWTIICFGGGGLAFMGLDLVLDRFKSSAGQLVAMLSDFIPEALALGAAFAAGGKSAWLLAGLMALQNFPEGFNAFRELTDRNSEADSLREGVKPSKKRQARQLGAWKTVGAFFLMALLGPLAGVVGFAFLAEQVQLVGGLMLFAAGGILYLVFQDIAPKAVCKNRWGPSLGCVLGFLLGIIGNQWVG